MRFVIFGGTTEGRELSRLLAEAGAEVTVCVASSYGAEVQGVVHGVRVKTGPLTAEEKLELLRGCVLCVDATHPYAAHIKVSVREACEKSGVKYLRVLRPPSDMKDAVCFDTSAAAAEWLSNREGNILLTTGAKEITDFSGLEPERIYPRVLPERLNLERCEALGIPHRNVIAMQGPFSAEMNQATIRQYDIRFLVTKDGGKAGGFPEKVEAARETGTVLVLLRRPPDNGQDSGVDFDTAVEMCMTLLESGDAIGPGVLPSGKTESEGERTT